MNKSNKLVILSALAGLSAIAPAHAASDPTGVWMNDTGKGAIEIKQCGKHLCGHLVWTKSKRDAKRGCGKQLIGKAKKVGRNTWDRGWIYSPERKKRYSVELKPLRNDRLRVMGYAGSKFFSKTMIWKRAPETLVRCDNGLTIAATNAQNEAPEANVAKRVEPKKNVAKTPKPKLTAKPQRAKPQREAALAPKDAPSATEDAVENEEIPVLPPEPRLLNKGQLERDKASQQEDEYASRSDNNRSDGDDDYDNEPYDEDDGVSGGKRSLNLGGIDVEKVFQKRNGRCKLDLPWVKLDIRCDD